MLVHSSVCRPLGCSGMCNGVFQEQPKRAGNAYPKTSFSICASSPWGCLQNTKAARIYQLENFVFSWCILALGVFGGIRINYLVTEMRWVRPVVMDLTTYTPLSFTSELTLERTSKEFEASTRPTNEPFNP